MSRSRSSVEERRTVVALLLGAAAWNVLGNLLLPGDWYVPANLAASGVVLLVGRRAGLSSEELGLSRGDVARGVGLGGVAALVVGVVLAVGLAVPSVEHHLADDVVAADSTGMRWFRPLVRIPLGTVLFEELLFRSVLYGLLLRRHGATAALVLTAVLFGLWHVVPAWETAEGTGLAVTGAVVGTVVLTAAAGALFALLRRWAGSVVAPMIAHVATNSLAYVAALVALDVIL